ncbi:hypothetical protein QN277_018426 [Acacia crassicarpa]|uniref:Uncharacterized protein n=1 Tax=Acacia crassicarpa TaxID=499986 RepID=A0AAE1JWA0_9FABA|nr:hypothetical protein QN277_018426 [Acacia crassicarpa]
MRKNRTEVENQGFVMVRLTLVTLLHSRSCWAAVLFQSLVLVTSHLKFALFFCEKGTIVLRKEAVPSDSGLLRRSSGPFRVSKRQVMTIHCLH